MVELVWTRPPALNACVSMGLAEICVKQTLMSVNHSLVSMVPPVPITLTHTHAHAEAAFPGPIAKSTMRTALPLHASMEVAVSMASIITLAFAPMASPDPIASYPSLNAATTILAKTAASALIRITDITLVNVPLDGRAITAKRSSIGAVTHLAKMEPVVCKEVLLSSASVKLDGLENSAM